MIGTGFLLFLFPSAILFLNDVKVVFKWAWTGSKPNRESVEKVIINMKREQEKYD